MVGWQALFLNREFVTTNQSILCKTCGWTTWPFDLHLWHWWYLQSFQCSCGEASRGSGKTESTCYIKPVLLSCATCSRRCLMLTDVGWWLRWMCRRDFRCHSIAAYSKLHPDQCLLLSNNHEPSALSQVYGSFILWWCEGVIHWITPEAWRIIIPTDYKWLQLVAI